MPKLRVAKIKGFTVSFFLSVYLSTELISCCHYHIVLHSLLKDKVCCCSWDICMQMPGAVSVHLNISNKQMTAL